MGLYDAVPVPPQDEGKADALRLLRDRFPAFSQSFGDPDNAERETAEPYYSYSRLVEWVLAKKDDKALLQKVSSFINELILSKDNLLEELGIIEVLEGLAQDPDMILELSPLLVPEAQSALKKVEQRMYGRF